MSFLSCLFFLHTLPLARAIEEGGQATTIMYSYELVLF
jgi:hypothetical protein